MFDNLKKAFSDVSKGFSEKELKEKDIEDVLFEFEINLLESDVATEVIDSIKESLKERASHKILTMFYCRFTINIPFTIKRFVNANPSFLLRAVQHTT